VSGTRGDALADRLEGFQAREREKVDAQMAAIAAELAASLDPAIGEPLRYALSTSGKRLRPILFLCAYQAAGGTAPPERERHVHRLSCAVEIVHTYSLVHDDLPCMDDDDLRRGRPTLHRVFDVPSAIIAGAALLPVAVKVIEAAGRSLGIPEVRRATLVRELCRAAGAEGMVGGQLRDLQAESRPIDSATLEGIHRAKTGALLTASLRLGAIAADAPAGLLDALTRYGSALGLAFQITDDILDEVGDSVSLGKVAGRDRELRKASYPSLHGLEGARALARQRADEALAVLRGVESPQLVELANYVVERTR
jgi:geranylgeranyl diphosphate synthase, type II